MGILDGKVAVITGSGRGIGRALAIRSAQDGARVVINDTGTSPSGTGANPEVAAQVAAEIRAAGGQAVHDTHDVSKRAGCEALFHTAIEAFGKVDFLITNAGVVREGAVTEITDDDWNAQMSVFMYSTFVCTQLFVRHLQSRKSPGRILLVSSQLGLQGAAMVSTYCSAKGGINGFGLTMAQELAPMGITVNILSPMAYTRLTAGLPLMDFPNAEQLMSPDFCGDISSFLLSEAGSNITGKIVHQQGTQLSVFKISMTDGLLPKNGPRWTVEELTKRWSEIIR